MNTNGVEISLHQNNLRAQQIGPYRIEACLGQGILTTAYRARATDDSHVILTEITAQEQVSVDPFFARFQQEVEAVQRLSHPHLLPLTDFGIHAGHPYLVTPDVEGTTLASLLQASGVWNTEAALLLLEQIASALDYAHEQGVLHRILQPAAIVITRDHQACVSGWGLARILEADGLPRESMPSHTNQVHLLSIAGSFLGNPAYVAPERVRGLQASKKSDIYALGILLFEMLTGHPPFLGTDFLSICLQPFSSSLPRLSELRTDISAAVDEVIHTATHCVPQRRFDRASDLVQAYRTAQATCRSKTNSHQQVTQSPDGESMRTEHRRNVVTFSALQVAPWLDERSDLIVPDTDA